MHTPWVPSIDYKALASDWLRALRGGRSQEAFSRRLGYGSNIAYRWEAGLCWPSASKTFWAIDHLGGDVAGSLARFYRRPPSWLARADLGTPRGVGLLLSDLRGTASIRRLAERTGLNRFSVARWARGDADPALPALLALIEATSLRLLDFIAAFEDPADLPSVSDEWTRLQEAREMAYEEPWSQALLRALELKGYSALARHRAGWIASRVGMEASEEKRLLALLKRTGQIRWTGRHFQPTEVRNLDTRSDPLRARALKAHWGEVALERLRQGSAGLYSYNVSAVSREGLERLQELQRAHYREMSRVIAESSSPECVVLYAAQLCALSEDDDER